MRRDPFARRPAADMLPGSDRAFVQGVRLRAQTSPKQMVEGIAAYLFRAPPVETCQQYEQRVLNADSETERDEDLDRYLRECPGD